MAATISGLRASAVATPNTVTGMLPRGEQPPQPPEPGARAILEHQLHVHVTLPGPGRRAEHVGEEGLGGLVAVQDRVLAAFLEIDHELHGDARAAGPARIGRRAAIAGEVARIMETEAGETLMVLRRRSPAAAPWQRRRRVSKWRLIAPSCAEPFGGLTKPADASIKAANSRRNNAGVG